MFLSGHPLDHHKFELKHYGITTLSDLNEFKDTIDKQPNPGRQFRILGLVPMRSTKFPAREINLATLLWKIIPAKQH
jgi:hypothetical protein